MSSRPSRETKFPPKARAPKAPLWARGEKRHPLIRWAGSKRQIIPRLITRIPEKFDRYIEPFAGSACLYFAIAPKKAIISDLNAELIDAYQTIIRHPIRVLRLAKSLGSHADDYYSVRELEPSSLPPTHRAARFLYLNRHCFNAIYRTNRFGVFNVPIGNRTGGFPDENAFRHSAEVLGRAQLSCCDFQVTLDRAKKGDFVYLDPPYVSEARIDRNEYGCGSFSIGDIPRILTSLEGLHRKQIPFLFSYSYCEDLIALLPKKVTSTIRVRRHIAGKSRHRGFAREVLLTNADVFGPLIAS